MGATAWLARASKRAAYSNRGCPLSGSKHILVLAVLAFACESSPRAVEPDAGGLSLEALADPEACAECHPSHYLEWQGSMHAYSGVDPVFVAMNARGQRETNGALGTFCVQCHAPRAVRLGQTTDGLNLESLPDALRGIGCIDCHSVTAVEGDANNPLVQTEDGVLRAGISDPMPTSAHASAHSPLHDGADRRSSALCGSCHDIVSPTGVHVERTFLEWKRSIYASDDPRFANSCVACHMPGRDGVAAEVPSAPPRRVHDHSFPGVDVALTDFPGRAELRDKVQASLDVSLISELCVAPADGGADLEVYLENVAAGHGFPSGAAHNRRVWLELRAYVGERVVFETGVVADDESLPDAEADPSLWALYDRLFDADGAPTDDLLQVARHEGETLPPPNGALPGDPDYVNVHVPRRFRILGETPDRIEMRVRIRPFELSILDRLVRSGDLAPEIAEAAPTFTLEGTEQVWTADSAEERTSELSGRPILCVGAPTRAPSVRPDP